jgi:hypothetical protein
MLSPQDLRNHGDSPHDARHDYLAMADDVEEFMAAHGLEKATLIGHSMFVTRPSMAVVRVEGVGVLTALAAGAQRQR